MPPPGTITCFLCGGTHIYPGPRYEAHLQNEHGAIFDLDFLISVSLHKQTYSSLPIVAGPTATTPPRSTNGEDGNEVAKAEMSTQTSQTGEMLCVRCEDPAVEQNGVKEEAMDEEEEQEDLSINISMDPDLPRHFLHVSPREVGNNSFSQEEEQDDGERSLSGGRPNTYAVDKSKRKVVGKEWAPNSFSSRFTCMFCGEQFRKDYKLKLHLMMAHKDQPADLMEQAKEELIKAKLDGCVHKCGLCGNKYNSIANFTRHIKDVHSLSRAQYKAEYGGSEVVSRMFTCELCNKEVKHTRNIIGAHMKMVHLISWKEYQDIICKLRAGEGSISLPNPELFDCEICGVSVKYKREHLNKKHQVEEDVYEELIAKKARGEDISEDLPEREIYTCCICERECMDFKRHLQVSHKLTEEQYREEFCGGQDPQVRIVKQGVYVEGGDVVPSALLTPANQIKSPVGSTPTKSPGGAGGLKRKRVRKEKSEEVEEPLSTDLQCYFQCDEVFKKDYQLHLHLKLKHRDEPPEELEKAYEAANEEIALTRRSASLFNCALCPRVFNDAGAFYGHIQNKHDISYMEYKKQYGRCETESQPFECKICGKVVKYDRNTVHTHLKNVHGINWARYLDRIRALRRGQEPEPLPKLKMVECRVCSVSVKYLREHLKNAHKITEKEYMQLFSEDGDAPVTAGDLRNEWEESKPKKSKVENVQEEERERSEDLDQEVARLQQVYGVQGLQEPKKEMLEEKERATQEQELPEPTVDLRVVRPPKADIQNKENKTCSVCQVVFDARKAFIEHCQVVHGMKFKTKSGISIPPPAIVKQDDDFDGHQDGRGGGDANSSQERVERQGLMLGMTVGGKEEGGGGNPSGKPSKWNQCTFQCALCLKTSNSRASIVTHIVEEHGLTFREYRAKHPDLEIHSQWLLCRLCNMQVKFTKESISGHLKLTHGTDLATYEQCYMQEEDWPGQSAETGHRPPEPFESDSLPGQLVIAELEHGGGQAAFEEEQQLFVQRGGGETISAVKDGNKDPNKDSVWNRCQFQCALCAANFTDRRNIKSHVVSAHNLSYQDYVASCGDPEVPTPKWICAICGSGTRHARNNIYIHLRDCHSITCDQYAAQYGFPGEDTAQRSTEVKEAPPPLQKEATQFSSKWNKCRFICHVCNKVANEKRHIRSHTLQKREIITTPNQVHGTSLDVLEAENGDCEIHTEYFFCAVCHAEVKHCHRNILMHLQRSHNMNTQDYEAKYGEMDTGIDMVAPPPAGEEALQENDQGFEEQDLDQGFGQHFLITDTSGSLLPLKNTSNSSSSTPKVQRVSKTGPGGKALSASGRLVRGTGDIPCENCGRMFSSHSNKERHKREHCHKFVPLSGRQAQQHQPTQDRWQDKWQDQEEHPCPFPDCIETFVKSVHVKRHLTSNHGVANPLQWLEDQGEQVRKVMAGVVNLDEEERLEAEGEQLEEHEMVHRSEVVDLEDSNPGYEEEGADQNNSYVEGSPEDNDNSQESFVDFEEKVPPLRIKLPSPSSTTTSSNVPPDSTSGPSMDKIEVRASALDTALDSEEDEEVDDQLEIIDENTINEEEEGDPADAPIGIIINESSEDGQGINDVVMVGDQLADKDDLEETLLE